VNAKGSVGRYYAPPSPQQFRELLIGRIESYDDVPLFRDVIHRIRQAGEVLVWRPSNVLPSEMPESIYEEIPERDGELWPSAKDDALRQVCGLMGGSPSSLLIVDFQARASDPVIQPYRSHWFTLDGHEHVLWLLDAHDCHSASFRKAFLEQFNPYGGAAILLVGDSTPPTRESLDSATAVAVLIEVYDGHSIAWWSDRGVLPEPRDFE
jgi:hypothetical protein